MDAKKKEAIMECTSFDELLDAEYGERGTEAREISQRLKTAMLMCSSQPCSAYSLD